MFRPPPFPPKDYILKSVPKQQLSSLQFTPHALPRVTQSNLGFYCYPIEYDINKGEVPENIQIEPVHRSIMNKSLLNSRAYWVPKPGLDDHAIHDEYRKYSVIVDDYDIRFKNKEKIFNRSYNYELICLDEARLIKLLNKCKKEELDREKRFRYNENKEHLKKHPPVTVQGCRPEVPFWWKENKNSSAEDAEYSIADKMVAEKEMDRSDSGRWAEPPSLTGVGVDDDPCKRRENMLIVGQHFKNEACNFYYKNYPPPKIKFRPEKFA